MTRNLLDKRMKLLISELAEMGSLVEKQIYNSIEAFRNKDMELATQVMNNDDKVDELNRKIEEQCLKLMAMESPVATDLRKIFTTSKIVTDLERMADYAVDICKIAKRVEGDILGEECQPIWQMVDILRKMITVPYMKIDEPMMQHMKYVRWMMKLIYYIVDYLVIC